MGTLAPWLAIAGLGALHGLNPANGWMFAAAWGVQSRDASRARSALLPIAIGHAASIALVACAIARGVSMDRAMVQGLAGLLLIAAASWRIVRGSRSAPIDAPRCHAGMTLWSFLMATAHGSGLMLVPALMPLCLGAGAARGIAGSGSLAPALAAVAVHAAAMLAATGLAAAGICRGLSRHPGVVGERVLRQGWTAVLGIAGVLLVASR